VAPQQVVVAMLPRRLCRGVGRQNVPTAHMCHLVTGGIERATRPRDMRQINGVSGVGHIQNGSSVSLAGESQPVNGRASMVSHVRDVAMALANDERLIGRASVQGVMPTSSMFQADCAGLTSVQLA